MIHPAVLACQATVEKRTCVIMYTVKKTFSLYIPQYSATKFIVLRLFYFDARDLQ